ncbi:DarT ssDNA thymidine ADP-ribosyltransferase family protein [Sulfurimonas sp.]|uniref:DarT ssDNA thymidine ADP-ribosyltransferase family protein n=1 Tax=Sulfurimonas sp. TaxID=2022749 RepID=UPI003565F974
MSQSIKNGKLLYHLTALSNIESILRDGLKPRHSLDGSFKDVAEQEIIDFRNRHKISDLVPFHFFLGTPFAGRVQIDHPDEEFVYITLHRKVASNPKNNFKIFPTHPKHMKPLKIFDYEEGLKKIDWDLMEKRDYSNSECKEVCMAECVAVHVSVQSSAFHSIIVKSVETKNYLEELCQRLYNTNCKASFFIDVEAGLFIGR